MTTTTNNQRIRSPSLAKYIKNVQQANERTAEQYEYRLSKFEKYIIVAAYDEEGRGQQQQQNLEQITALDQVLTDPIVRLPVLEMDILRAWLDSSGIQ
ncbi:MAG: hypothetical protein M3288_00320 [Thermoproteota archaeon]|nr:hypothetical protein [Thermoproteota archaeon]